MIRDVLLNLSIASAATGISKTISGPLELWRIQRQQSFIPNSTLKDVIKMENIRYLWKGNLSNVVKGVPQYSINWALFQKINEKIDNNLISGVFAGGISIGIIYPLETTRTYLSLQTNKNKYKGICDCLKRAPKSHLYKGFTMSVMGAGAFSGWLYKFRGMLNENYPQFSHINSGIASIGALCITYPTDLMRRRLQLQQFDKSVPIYNNNRDVVKKIIKNEGIRGFYKGIHANFVKSFFHWNIHFYILESLNKLIKGDDI